MTSSGLLQLTMQLNAIGVTTTNLTKAVEFYRLLGFNFPEFSPDEDHLEAVTAPGGVRLMLDSAKLITEILGEKPVPANHSSFALEYDSVAEVDETASKVNAAGFKVVKEPWDAFWGQRYCIVEDPDGYKVDLYARL